MEGLFTPLASSIKRLNIHPTGFFPPAIIDYALDPNGKPLVIGSMYYHTANKLIRHYDGTQWADYGTASGIGVISVINLAALRLMPLVANQIIIMEYHTAVNDGGGGLFLGVTGATQVDDNGITIVVAGGAWERTNIGNEWDMRWFGTVHDGVADDSIIWQNVITACSLAGGGTVNVSAISTFINANIRVRSNVHLVVNGEVIYGDRGRISLAGHEKEPAGGSSIIMVDIPLGATVVSVLNVSTFLVGDFCKIRGNRDIVGVASTVEVHSISAIDPVLKTLTFNRPTKSLFTITWPASPFALNGGLDATSVSPLLTSKITVDLIRGDDLIHVINTALFALDDTIMIHDDEMGVDAANGFNPSSNLLHQETAIIVAIDPIAKTLQIANKLHHSYTMAFRGIVTSVATVSNAKVTGASASYNVLSTTQKHSFETSFSRDCIIRDCHVNGSFLTGFGNVGHGFRVDTGINNTVENCSVRSPQVTTPAAGYGFSLYGSTGCKLLNNYASGCRHSFILFKGAAGNLIQGNTSYGCMNSDYDLHGSNEIDNVIDGNISIGTPRITADSSGHAMIRVGNPYHIFGAHNNIIRNNTGHNLQDTFINVQVASKGNIIENNAVYDCDIGIRLNLPGSASNGNLPRDLTATAEYNDIRNNTIVGCRRGLDIDGQVNKSVLNNRITDNSFIKVIENGIYVINSSANDFSGSSIQPIVITVPPISFYWAVFCNASNDITMDNLHVLDSRAGIYLSNTINFSATSVVMNSLFSGIVLRTGASDVNVKFLDYRIKGFTPQWVISIANPTSIKSFYNAKTEIKGTLALPIITAGALINPSNVMPLSTAGVLILDTQWTPASPMSDIIIELFVPYVSIDTSDSVSITLFVDEQLGLGPKLIATTTERITAGATAGNSMYMVSGYTLTHIINSTAVRIFAMIGERSGTKAITIGGKYAATAQPRLLISEG